jgi:hypothetical protein
LRKAAASDSTFGKAAARDLARLELPQHPDRYIKVALGLDRDGYLNVVVQNQSGLAVRDVAVVVGRRTAAGVRRDASYRLDRVLQAGERRTLRSQLGPMDVNTARSFGAAVVGARLVE